MLNTCRKHVCAVTTERIRMFRGYSRLRGHSAASEKRDWRAQKGSILSFCHWHWWSPVQCPPNMATSHLRWSGTTTIPSHDAYFRGVLRVSFLLQLSMRETLEAMNCNVAHYWLRELRRATTTIVCVSRELMELNKRGRKEGITLLYWLSPLSHTQKRMHFLHSIAHMSTHLSTRTIFIKNPACWRMLLHRKRRNDRWFMALSENYQNFLSREETLSKTNCTAGNYVELRTILCW